MIAVSQKQKLAVKMRASVLEDLKERKIVTSEAIGEENFSTSVFKQRGPQ
jgi:hypothetical protein